MFLTPSEYLSRFGRRASKSLGQHFLVQPNTARRMVESLEIEPGDIVVEIGPGLGALTRYLIEYPCYLHLVELDEKLAGVLQGLIPPCKALVRWHVLDILRVKWREFLTPGGQEEISETVGEADLQTGQAVLKVIGNIPYNISSPLLFHLIDSFGIVERAVLMVQREVGLRWTAEVSTRDYGIPTVILKSCAYIEKLFSVGHGQFFPPPKVESLAIRLKFFSPPLWMPLSFSFFRRFVSEVFRQRRKKIMKGLEGFLSKNRDFQRASNSIELCLERAGIPSSVRPQDVSPEGFAKLARCVAGIEPPG